MFRDPQVVRYVRVISSSGAPTFAITENVLCLVVCACVKKTRYYYRKEGCVNSKKKKNTQFDTWAL